MTRWRCSVASLLLLAGCFGDFGQSLRTLRTQVAAAMPGWHAYSG